MERKDTGCRSLLKLHKNKEGVDPEWRKRRRRRMTTRMNGREGRWGEGMRSRMKRWRRRMRTGGGEWKDSGKGDEEEEGEGGRGKKKGREGGGRRRGGVPSSNHGTTLEQPNEQSWNRTCKLFWVWRWTHPFLSWSVANKELILWVWLHFAPVGWISYNLYIVHCFSVLALLD